MKFAFTLLPIVTALRFVGAGPVGAQDLTVRAPVPVTKLVCDGDAYDCTASLKYGDGRWVAQWAAHVYHQDMFGNPTGEKITIRAPVPVTSLQCDGDTYKCTAKLRWGDGNWVAQWNVAVYHKALFSQEAVGAMAPVPIRSLACDGDSHMCAADLVWGDGNWVAEWGTSVFHRGL